MGDTEGAPLPSGLNRTQAAAYAESFTKSRSVDDGRWKEAEDRTEELIKRIRGTRSSERHRKEVADYVCILIQKNFDCQVNTFGSVPLKTYLPHGDIDLTIVSRDPRLKDSWANAVKATLEKAERNGDGKFQVEGVSFINAEVKLIKCTVEKIVVDISFNQFGGLCTLCFLEEVDRVIGNDHFFKRSIILVKAWCYYDAIILGAHHGLISTYALETLVLYIFHVFHNCLRGPLEVLLRFLEFFSVFDWDRYAISVWGPVPLSSLPAMIAESPRSDGGELLLSKDFLDACVEDYAVFLSGPDSNQGRTFQKKFLNVVDPLLPSNNLGRSVNQTNFYRITQVFGRGARKLLNFLLDPSRDIDELFDDKLDGFFKRINVRLDDIEPKRPDDAAGTAQLPTPDYYTDTPFQDIWITLPGAGADETDAGHSTLSNQSNQRKQSGAPGTTQMGGSDSSPFHPSATSNGCTDATHSSFQNGSRDAPGSSSSSVAHASHPPGFPSNGAKGRLANGEAVPKPLGVNTKARRPHHVHVDVRGSVDSSTQSSEGQDVASSPEYRNSYTQTNFDSNGALITTSSESPSSESSSRGSVSFSNIEAGSFDGPSGPSARRSSPNPSIETESSRRSSWSGDQPLYVASNGYLDNGQGYGQPQRMQESISRASSIPPLSVITHAPIQVTQMPTSMGASQPMTFTSQPLPFGFHAPGSGISGSMISESAPVGLGPRPYYVNVMQTGPRGPPAPPLPPGYFHGPPLAHHFSTTGEIPNSGGVRMTASFPVQQGDEQMYEQQQQAWQQQMEQMQLHGHGYLRAMPTMNAAVSPLPQLMNSENSTVISSSSAGYSPFQIPVSSLPTTRLQNGHGHEMLADEKAKAPLLHDGEAGDSSTGGKSSLPVGSEAGGGARAAKSSKGKEKATSRKGRSPTNEDASYLGSFVDLGGVQILGAPPEGSGQQHPIPMQMYTNDAASQLKQQGYPQQFVSIAGPSAYAQVVASSSLPHGTGYMASELSSYPSPPPPPPSMLPTAKTSVGYSSLPPQTSIQTAPSPSLPGSIPPAELVNGGASSSSKQQRQWPTESVPFTPNVYYPQGNSYPMLPMQRVYVVPPPPGTDPTIIIGLDGFNAIHYSKPFDSYDLSTSAAVPSDDSRLRTTGQLQQQQQQQGRAGVGERLRAAGVATSSSSGSGVEANIATDVARATDGSESSFLGAGSSGGDLLSSNLNDHVRNLDYARWCQNKHVPFAFQYQPSYVPSPKYYPEYRAWEGPGRPLPPNANVYSNNVMNYGHGLVQGPPSMSNGSVRMAGSFPRGSFAGPPGSYSSEELPKAHGGTGTFLPNPKPPFMRDKSSTGNGRNPHGGYNQDRGESSGNGRNAHGGYGQDRGERVDRDGNPVNGPRLRGTARGERKYESRPQAQNVNTDRNHPDFRGGGGDRDRSRDRDRDRDRDRGERDVHRQQHEGQRRNSNPVPIAVVAPGAAMAQSSAGPPVVETYSVAIVTENGRPATSGTAVGTAGGGSVPSVVVVAANPLEFGSVGQVQGGASQAAAVAIELDNGGGADQVSSTRSHEQQQVIAHVVTSSGLAGLYLAAGDGSSQGPSSPKQRVTQGAYELKEEDFPPLSFRGQH